MRYIAGKWIIGLYRVKDFGRGFQRGLLGGFDAWFLGIYLHIERTPVKTHP